MAHPGDAAVPVPFYSKLTQNQRLEAGQTLIIHGKINQDATRFDVNLLHGAAQVGPQSDAVLHMSLRFDEGKIVFNTHEGGAWKKEERVSNPFKKGGDFDLRVRVHDEKFEVMADQKSIHDFKFRIPAANVDHFAVVGDVSLSGIHWGGRYYSLPYETGFHDESFRTGKRIFLYGKPTGKRFEINLYGRNNDILFHYNPRFSEKQVVRNAQVGGTWGNEEREGTFPFKKNIGFDLVILNEPYSIQIFHNNERVGTFSHRTSDPNRDYVRLGISGDLELTGLEFSH